MVNNVNGLRKWVVQKRKVYGQQGMKVDVSNRLIVDGPGKYTGGEKGWKWITLRGWTSFVHFCSVEPSTHVSTNEQLRTQLSCLSPPKPEIQTNEASILWILDSAFRLTNYILVFSHWDFLILFTKVLKLRKLSKISNFIDSQDNQLMVWNTNAW